MKRYLLDTGILVAYLQGKPSVVQLVSPMLTSRHAATSIASGLLKSDLHKMLNLRRLLQLLNQNPDILPGSVWTALWAALPMPYEVGSHRIDRCCAWPTL
jgi:predicted nucleic acid-binding protein